MYKYNQKKTVLGVIIFTVPSGSPEFQADSLPSEPPRKSIYNKKMKKRFESHIFIRMTVLVCKIHKEFSFIIIKQKALYQLARELNRHSQQENV